ncbi:MAG: hypothetical protein ACOYKF_02520 [Phenylobacterium sp.]
MAIFYPDILEQRTAPRTFSYGDKDVMLYALGIGLGQDPMDETELAFVYENGLKVVPTAATVLAATLRGASGPAPEMPAGHRPSQINFLMVVHGEQKVELHKPLPTSGPSPPKAAPSVPTTRARARARSSSMRRSGPTRRARRSPP